MTETIIILPSSQIDFQKWDLCVQQDPNGLIYSTSDYLSAVAENWHGIIINDYEAVMPIPWKKKFGIRYGYAPAFIQQLGVSGSCSKEVLSKVILTLSSFLSYGDFRFNFSNIDILDITPVTYGTNLLLPLSPEYKTIFSKYKPDVMANIRKSKNEDLVYITDFNLLGIDLYQELYGDRTPKITRQHYSDFKRLCNFFQQKNQCITRIVTDTKGEILASAILLKDNTRLYNLLNATTIQGKAKNANYFLLDTIFKEFAGKLEWFDFEGSDLPGVKEFYEKFGAVNQPYFHYHLNQLPKLLRLIKH